MDRFIYNTSMFNNMVHRVNATSMDFYIDVEVYNMDVELCSVQNRGCIRKRRIWGSDLYSMAQLRQLAEFFKAGRNWLK